jgi:hypothetical protein
MGTLAHVNVPDPLFFKYPIASVGNVVPPPAPVAPLGIVKLRIAAPVVPELVTLAVPPAGPVVVVPTVTVAAKP